jgi:hypothetical protein
MAQPRRRWVSAGRSGAQVDSRRMRDVTSIVRARMGVQLSEGFRAIADGT